MRRISNLSQSYGGRYVFCFDVQSFLLKATRVQLCFKGFNLKIAYCISEIWLKHLDQQILLFTWELTLD